MKFELKSIGYWSAIRVSFIVNLILGLIIGFFFAIFVGLMFSLVSNFAGMSGMAVFEEDMPPIGLLLILYPFILGFGGAVFNTIIVVLGIFIYNMIGKYVGGLEFEMNEIRLQPITQAPYVAPYTSPRASQTIYTPPPPVQPLPPDLMSPPPDGRTDNGTPSPRHDEGFQI